MGKAPDFTLNSVLDGQQEKVNLSELRGQHVLVMFYPVDFGYVTPTEFYSLAPLIPELSDMNCTLLAISTEHISSQMKSQITPRSQAGLDLLGVRLASDPAGEVARLYGVYKAEENLAFSAFYLIDPEGNIVAMEKCDFPVGRSTEEQVRMVAKLVDREDEVNTSDVTSNKLGRGEPFVRGPTMGRGPLAGGSVKSFNTNISTRGTKTPSVAGWMSKNDARSVRSSKTPFAFSKQNSSKAGGSVASSNTGNSPFANSKQNSSADKPNPKKKTQ